MPDDPPHPLDYQPRPEPRIEVEPRPLWRNYIVACVLVAVGFEVVDLGAGTHGIGKAVGAIGAAMFFVGLSIFAAAMSWSLWYTIRGILRKN